MSGRSDPVQHALPFAPCRVRWYHQKSHRSPTEVLVATASRDELAPYELNVLRAPIVAGEASAAAIAESFSFSAPSAFTDLCFEELCGSPWVLASTEDGTLFMQRVTPDGKQSGGPVDARPTGDPAGSSAQLLCVAARGDLAAVGTDAGSAYAVHVEGSQRNVAVRNAGVGAVYDVELAEDKLVAAGAGITVWDMRVDAGSAVDQAGNVPVSKPAMRPLSKEGDIVHSIALHPSQSYYIVAGMASGVIDVWDSRNPRCPVGSGSAHSSNVWDVRFSERRPNVLVSCSQDTKALVWQFGPETFTPVVERAKVNALAPAGQLGVSPLVSVDVHPETEDVVVASDSEALFFVNRSAAFRI